MSKVTDIIVSSMKLNWTVTKEKHYYLTNVVSINYRQKDPKEIKKILNHQLQMLRNRSSEQVKHIETMQELMVVRWRNLKREKKIVNESVIVRSESPRSKSLNIFAGSTAHKTPKILPKIFRKTSLCESRIL